MDGAMGQEEDVVEAVLTCEGDFHDPELNSRIERFRHRLKDLLLTEKQRLQVKKVEPWNSVKVTFTIPREAALRLRQLAQTGNDALRQMGVLSVQIQGDTQISLTIAGRNNESTQLVLCTPPTIQAGNSSLPLNTQSGIKKSEDLESSQAASNDELTRKNIVHYLRQGSVFRQNQALFDSILGTGTSSVPVLGFGLDISQPVESAPGPSGNNTLFRPNNIATSTLQSQTVGGPHLNSNFQFSTGAFHPPVPRVPYSAGQRSATNSTHHIQPGSISSGRSMGPLGHDPPLNTQPSLSDIGLGGHVFQHNMNSFSPVGATRHLPATTSTTLSSMSLHSPLSSSPTSSFMIDLPPPPPYPSGSNMSRQGKPVTSSSPLLVNLLQTDPITAAVGLASGNPNKPMTAGELSSSSQLKKKQQYKKTKDVSMKPYLFSENAVSNRTGVHPRLLLSEIDLDQSNTRIAEDTINSVDLIQTRLGLLPASHILDSFITTSLPDSRSLFSSDHPVSDSPPFEEFHTDFNRRGVVGPGCDSSKTSDSNGQEQFSSDLDPFSLEIAAGKIINPYTGQLEPRDSFVDSVQARTSDQSSHSQGDNLATQMLARKAKELKKVHDNRVPDLPSQMLDAHVRKTAVPVHINVSTSAAAFVHSGGPLQASIDKLTSVSSHRRNLIGDGSSRETKESPFSSSVYAVTGKPWQEMDSSTDLAVKVSSNTGTNSSSRKAFSSLSTSLHKNFALTPVPFNGPSSGGQIVRHNVSPSQHHHVAVSSCSSGLRLSPQGSVIYSNVTKSSSSPLFPVSHNSYITQTQSQQMVASTAASHLSAPSSLQNSVTNTVSLPISYPSRLGSTSFSSSQPPIVTERLKTDSSHVFNQHNKAASSDTTEGSTAIKKNPPNLLKSLPNKHVDPQNNTCSPPDNKASSEGDENSNHSGLITDTLPEHSGTAALLEHSGVKAENHDSGVGSSSERSDDTPSEPGDSEFRCNQVGSETEDTNKASLQKASNSKLDSKVNSTINTITVGYMVSPTDGSAQSKSVHGKDIGHASKTSVVTSSSPATVADISQFFQAHIRSMDKQTGLLTGGPHISVSMSAEGGKRSSHPNFTGRIRENGQSMDEMDSSATVKLNGPSSQSSIEKMIKTMSDLQHKKSRSSPKQNNTKASTDMPSEHFKLQTEVFEKMSKLQQFAESTKDTSDGLMKANSSDKSESPDALSQRLIVSEDRPDQLIFDLDELVNGKTIGHGGGGPEVKGGSNITSIYSKRSSPVNVNMLNHIYAPGLPLPRRLTESVQRLVKPLPASETSVSYSHVRPCKSPGSGGSPRSGSGVNIQTSLRMSGVRSPGASTPKLLPSDKHSLLSGGLDLAGFPNLKYAPSVSLDHTDLTTALANCKRRSPALTADVLLQDPHCFPVSQNSPPNLLIDSKTYSSKMLSQSFPPHKSREFKPNITHMNHGLIFSLQSNSSVFEKGLSPSVHTTHTCQLPRSKGESLQSTSQDSRFQPSNRSHQDIWQSNHVSSVQDSCQARQAPQQLTTAENSHSTNNSHAVETSSSAYTSHSNAPSPVMPVLQRGLEPPGTATGASSMPNISSQPSCSISSSNEISVFSIGSSLSLTDATVSSQNKHVPYTNNTVATSGTAVNATAKSPPVSSPVPLLSTVSTASLSGITEDLSIYSAPPRLSLSTLDVSSSAKVKKTLNSPSPSMRNGSNTPQFSRNLFESVSGTLTHDNISVSKKEPASNNSVDSYSHENSRLTAYVSDSKSDPLSSVHVPQDSKGELVMKNMRNISTDVVEKRAATIVPHCSSKTDFIKISPASRSKQSSHDLSLSPFLSTEVVNLDFSLPLQACNAISLNIGTSKSTGKTGSAVKTSCSATDGVQENTSLVSNQSYTSSISSVSYNRSDLSWTTLDSMSDVTSSSAADKEEAASKLVSSLPASSTLSVKEPILEMLASALESSMTKTNLTSSGKSFVEKHIPSRRTSLEFQQSDEDVTTKGKMVTIQSSPHQPSAYQHHQVSLELSHSQSAADQSSDSFSRIAGKKRRSFNSEEDADSSTIECKPVKQPHFSLSRGSPIRSTAKSPMAESFPTHMDSQPETDGTEVQDGRGHTQPKSPTVVVRESLEKETEKCAGTTLPLQAKQEDKSSERNAHKPCIISASDKEQVNNTESRPQQSTISVTDSSDEGPSNTSSNESRDSTHRESRLHRTVTTSTPDNKERRAHRAGMVSAATEDRDPPKDGHSSKLSSDHLDNSHNRDSRSHRSTSDATDEKDNKEYRTQRSSSADDKEKTKSSKDSTDKPGNWDKTHIDSKLDDAQKKSHRIRRQFYAYVPEKSIDQTYFDTPILSGRTRSRNKPGSDTAAGHEEGVPIAASAGESQVHHSIGGGLQAAASKTDGSAETTGGKRPMRSVRTKDNTQDQSASKRRRVQQHR